MKSAWLASVKPPGYNSFVAMQAFSTRKELRHFVKLFKKKLKDQGFKDYDKRVLTNERQ